MALNRRTFVTSLLSSPLAAAYQKAAQGAPPMRIRRIETVYWKSREDAPFWPHWTWVKIDTDSGVSGIGEAYPRNTNEAAAIHGVAGQCCQRFYERDWPGMLENPIAPREGFIQAPEEPGFGMKIKPEAWNHTAAVRQVSGR